MPMYNKEVLEEILANNERLPENSVILFGVEKPNSIATFLLPSAANIHPCFVAFGSSGITLLQLTRQYEIDETKIFYYPKEKIKNVSFTKSFLYYIATIDIALKNQSFIFRVGKNPSKGSFYTSQEKELKTFVQRYM